MIAACLSNVATVTRLGNYKKIKNSLHVCSNFSQVTIDPLHKVLDKVLNKRAEEDCL